MTVAAKIASIRRSIALLIDINSDDATQLAAALSLWLDGHHDFEQAIGLPTDWPQRLRFAARDAALSAIEALHPDLDSHSLAERIVGGVSRARPDDDRPDGELGYLHDLAIIDARLSVRHWRRLITDIRGHRQARNGHNNSAP